MRVVVPCLKTIWLTRGELSRYVGSGIRGAARVVGGRLQARGVVVAVVDSLESGLVVGQRQAVAAQVLVVATAYGGPAPSPRRLCLGQTGAPRRTLLIS